MNPGLPVNYESLACLVLKTARHPSIKGHLAGSVLRKIPTGKCFPGIYLEILTVTKLSYFLTPRLRALPSAWCAGSLLSPPDTREELK